MTEENGTQQDNYLKPYTDAQMIYEALWMYASHRHAFASQICQKDYLNASGETPTKEERMFAVKSAEQADRIVLYAKKKAESPIIELG
jgi:hypothetical protein